MKSSVKAGYSKLHLANTNVMSLLDEQLILILRPWGSSEYNQKFIDEVTHYLSSTQADIEVTTPFDYQENLSSSANRTRVALLLAHDLFYKNENKGEYVVGFEATILFKTQNEIAWSSVGRFGIHKLAPTHLNTFHKCGSDLDVETLLPAQLIGVEREIDVVSGSIRQDSEGHKIIVSSTYGCEIIFNENSGVEINPATGTYWYSAVTLG